MPWIHAVAATLLVLGTLALFAFLRSVELLDDAEAEAEVQPGGVVAMAAAGPPATSSLRWPPPPPPAAAARHPSRAVDPDDAAELPHWSRAA